MYFIRMVAAIAIFLLLVAGSACSEGRTTPTSTASPETETPAPTDTTTPQPAATEQATEPATPTITQVATHTRAPSPTATPRPTNTRPPSPTLTPRPTDTPTSMSTSTAIAGTLSTATPTGSPTPGSGQTLECDVLPEGGFLTIWRSDPQLQATLGCPTSGHPRVEPAAWEVETSYQAFQHGAMLWSNKDGWYEQPLIFVLYDDGTYDRFDDTFDPETDPVSGGETAPNGLIEPQLGFGKVWREQPGVRDRLGWATAEEQAGDGRYQTFDMQHRMVWIEQTDMTYLFLADGTVRIFDIPY